MFLKSSGVLVLTVALLNVLGVLAAPPPESTHQFHQVTALPDDIPTCKEDENINECVRTALQQMLKRSKNGVPELNIQPIDPMIHEKTNLQFQNNFVQGKVAVRNLKVVGLSDTTVEKADFKRDGKQVKLITQSRTPKLQVDGQYRAEVFVNSAKMSSKGVFNVTITNIDAKTEIEAELYESDGHTYMRLTSFNVDPTLGDMKVYATGLVPDPVLNDALLEFANQNWRQIYKSVIPETRSTWEPMLLKNSNEFFSHLPFDLLLTETS